MSLVPQLLKSVGDYNIVAFKCAVYGIPQKLGPINLDEVDITGCPGVICDISESSVEGKIEERPATASSLFGGVTRRIWKGLAMRSLPWS
jgi:hypothetical protein